MNHNSSRWRIGVLVLGLVLALGVGTVLAQTTAGAIRGTVMDKSGSLPGATISAVNADSGFHYAVVSDAEGGFVLGGLPPGTYKVQVSMATYQPQARTVQVLVGQTLTVNFLVSAEMLLVENVTVVGSRIQENRSVEIATNVTKEQIENLPQNSRNFLNFAALAPGVRMDLSYDGDKKIQGTGQNSRQVNVFIDGLSSKNDILQGGAFMQDSSKGNPFPQSAVQEFRVITQNYKAEYDKASAAVITAVTRSGGNSWTGDVNVSYQNKRMNTLDYYAKMRGEKKPDYKRWQGAVSVGGPIITDKLHLFATYERNSQDRFNSVFFGAETIPDALKSKFAGYKTGMILAPFRSDLFFGKLTYQPAAGQTLDVSVNYRDEYDHRGFGGQRVYDGAEDMRIKTTSLVAKHQFSFKKFVNEALVAVQQMRWNPTPLFPSLVHENYFGILDIGGKDTAQNFKQDRISLRDDLLFSAQWHGLHAFKTGVSINFMKYDITKQFNYNPTFNYRKDEAWAYPFEAIYGGGDPSLKFNNNQYGIYFQDDWRLTPNFEINAGLRWDYESNMVNNEFRSPDAVVSALQSAQREVDGTIYKLSDYLDLNRFTTDGSRRDPYYGMIQPRLGFSYDVTGKGKTVLFGAWGKYYDRVLLNDIFDEQFKLNWKTRRFCFTADGSPRGDCPNPIKWDEAYRSKAGLDGLIASGVAPNPELFLVDNNLRPPRSDQYTLGIRQGLGNWMASASYNIVRGYNGLTWFFGDLLPNTTDRWGGNIPVSGYGRVFIGSGLRKSWYDAFYLTFEKPYTAESHWSMQIAYTYSTSEQLGKSNPSEGVDFSAFDYLRPSDLARNPSDFDERQRLVINAMVDLPYQFKLSTIINLSSGAPFDMYDASQGWDHFVNRWNAGRPEKHSFLIPLALWANRTMDLRLTKGFDLGKGSRITLTAEAFNIWNLTNEGCFNWDSGFIGPGGVTNPGFKKGTCQLNPRRLQFGAGYSF